MARIEINRPFFCFDDDGNLQAFDADGQRIESLPDKLPEIIADHEKVIRVEAMSIITVQGSCYKLVQIPGNGWIRIEVPCP